MELTEEVYNKIVACAEQGDQQAAEGALVEAIRTYRKGLKMIPQPNTDWEMTTWMYSAIADAFFELKNYLRAEEHFTLALSCSEGYANPFIAFRLGQLNYINENMEAAKEYLGRAYILGGEEVFKDEDEAFWNLIKDDLPKPYPF
jgi:tetratricopeptide (TPR) repeat protein